MVQDVDLELFEELEPNDILFIDSSHIKNIKGKDIVGKNIFARFKIFAPCTDVFNFVYPSFVWLH